MVTPGSLPSKQDPNPVIGDRSVCVELGDIEFLRSYKSKAKPTYKLDYNKHSCLRTLQTFIPILKWLPNYNWHDDLINDLLTGLTVAVMHIPQGMAYALLGNVPPVVGIYMAFFPVLMYFLFGTSRHVSIGTFAVICLMTGKVINKYSIENNPDNPSAYTSLQIAMTVSFTVAIIHFFLFASKLGSLSCLLSDSLVSGFTTGCAMHVILSQLFDFFGVPKYKETPLYFEVLLGVKHLLTKFPEANIAAIIISAVTLTILVVNNQFVRPLIERKYRFPLPSELIAITLGTICSRQFDFNRLFNVRVVGTIPVGLPHPQLPIFSLIPSILIDSIVIAIVSYTITISMALIFSKKENYEIDSNQELLAMGAANLMGSFFSCMPISASLSRSMVQYTVGGRTQLASIVSCSILFFVLLWIASEFEMLPRCILATIIIVALRSMVMQASCLKDLWKWDRREAFIWISTFLCVAVIDIGLGLICGVFLSFLVLVFPVFRPYSCLLGRDPYTNTFRDINNDQKLETYDNIRIFRYYGSLNQATKFHFKNSLEKSIPWIHEPYESQNLKQRIIIDMSTVSNIDQSGIEMLNQLQEEAIKRKIHFSLVAVASHLYEKFKLYDLRNGKLNHTFLMYVNIENSIAAVTVSNLEQ